MPTTPGISQLPRTTFGPPSPPPGFFAQVSGCHFNMNSQVTTVYVGNISDKADNVCVKQILEVCGKVVAWKRMAGVNGKLQDFGFCDFNKPEDTLRALRVLNEYQLGDKKLIVKVEQKHILLQLKTFAEIESGQIVKKDSNEFPASEMALRKDETVRLKIRAVIEKDYPRLIRLENGEVDDEPKKDAQESKDQRKESRRLDRSRSRSESRWRRRSRSSRSRRGSRCRSRSTRSRSRSRSSRRRSRSRSRRRSRSRSTNRSISPWVRGRKLSRSPRSRNRSRSSRRRSRSRSRRRSRSRSTNRSISPWVRGRRLSRSPRSRSRSSRRRSRSRSRRRSRSRSTNRSISPWVRGRKLSRSPRRGRRYSRSPSRTSLSSRSTYYKFARATRGRSRRRSVSSKRRSVSSRRRSVSRNYCGYVSDESFDSWEKREFERVRAKKELDYQARWAEWERREAKMLKKYRKDDKKEAYLKADKEHQIKLMAAFHAQYDDVKEDRWYYEKDSLIARRRDFERERERDEKDRRMEENEIEKSTSKGQPVEESRDKEKGEEVEMRDVEEEASSHEQEKAETCVTPLKDGSGSSDPHQPPLEVRKEANEGGGASLAESGVGDVERAKDENDVVKEGEKWSCFSAADLPLTFSPAGSSPAGPNVSPASEASPPPRSPLIAAAAIKTTILTQSAASVFAANEHEEEPMMVAKKKLKPFEITQEERIKTMTSGEIKKLQKEIIGSIPSHHKALFEYEVKREFLSNADLMGRVRKWVSKKIKEFIGEEDRAVIQYVCDKVVSHTPPAAIQQDLTMIIDHEAAAFTFKLWRLIIYETECAFRGISKTTR